MEKINLGLDASLEDADVVVFSDNSLFAYALSRLLQENTNLKATFLPSFAAYCPRLSPQFTGLLVISIDPRDASTVPLAARLRESLPQARLLAALLPVVGNMPLGALQHRVNSIWTDRSSLNELLEAVIVTINGGTWGIRVGRASAGEGRDGSASAAAKGARQAHLTPREVQILELMHKGFSNKSIAEHLYLSVSTIKNHMGRIFDKLGVANRTAAVLRSIELGLLPYGPLPNGTFDGDAAIGGS